MIITRPKLENEDTMGAIEFECLQLNCVQFYCPHRDDLGTGVYL